MDEQHPNSRANLKPAWSKENQPNNRGRKPSNMRKYIIDNGLTHTDIKVMAKYLFPMTQDKLEKLIKDKKTPIAMRIFARAIVKDLTSAKMTNVLSLMDRAYGKPKETVEVQDNKPQVIITLPDNGRDNLPEQDNGDA